MYTLVDFITHVKGIEYILSLAAIAGFLLFWEVLKPKPFKTVVETGKDDLGYIEQTGGVKNIVKSIGKIVSAPFIGLAYIVMLPVGFFAALAIGVVNLAMKGVASIAGKSMTFEWRPVEAYFAGRKKKKEQKAEPKRSEGK
ncbi:MAG: hypothetical protein ACM3MD_11025 [Betaproteobacteria bacterium]